MGRLLFHVNAFTSTLYRGSSAGVVLGADGMSDAQMQDLARELRHSETAFLFSADSPSHDVRVRYFTPTGEVPLCGRATVAAHYARATTLGLGAGTVTQRTAAGIQVVGITGDVEGPRRILMFQRMPAFEPPLSHYECGRVVAALGLHKCDLLAGAPLQLVSTDRSHVIVPLAPSVDLDALRPNLKELAQLSVDQGCSGYFVFQQLPGNVAATYGRMFAPVIGLDEDPVTENANASLGAYLVRHRLMRHDGIALRFEGRQGRALRRDGVVYVDVAISDDEPIAVTIAGEARILFRATMEA